MARDVPAGTILLGSPGMPHMEFKRLFTATLRLPEYAAKLRQLEQDVAALRARLGPQTPA